MVGITEFKSGILVIIDIIYHDAVNSFTISYIAISGKIQSVIFR